jgi:hypothetical protein
MTTTVGAKAEVTAYLDQVRAQLDDLPDAERDDLLEDLEQHLCEVSVEVDEPLAVRLGSPELYAAELRQSAGLPPRGAPPAGAWGRAWTAASRSGLARAGRTAWAHPAVEAVRRFSPETRPGWWVLRGVLLVGSWMVLFASPSVHDLPVPRLAGSRLATVALVVAAVWASVWLGRRSSSDPRLRATAILLNLVVLWMAFHALDRVEGRVGYRFVYQSERTPYLAHPDGTPITDIRPFGVDGTPLESVLLYDQDGRPITNVHGPHTHGVGADGRVQENRYPVLPAPAQCHEYEAQPQMCPRPDPTTAAPPATAPTTTAPPPAATAVP